MCIISSSYVNSNWTVTVRKRLSWVLTSVTLTFDLWPWPFAWTLLWSLVITPENFMMIRWWEHSEKGGTDGQTDNTICRAAWSQLKTYRLKTFADLRRRWRSCVTRIGHTAAADVPVDSCIQLSHLYASVPPVSFWCSWISWSSRNFRQRSWLHCGSYWSGLMKLMSRSWRHNACVRECQPLCVAIQSETAVDWSPAVCHAGVGATNAILG